MLRPENAQSCMPLATRPEVVLYSPYSTDLVTSDFSLFPKLKLKIKVKRFDTYEYITLNNIESLRFFSNMFSND